MISSPQVGGQIVRDSSGDDDEVLAHKLRATGGAEHVDDLDAVVDSLSEHCPDVETTRESAPV